MKAKTQITIGLVAAVILAGYLISHFVWMLVTLIRERPPLFMSVFLLVYALVIAALALYIFALFKKRLALAKWMYYIWLAFIISYGLLLVLCGIFTLPSLEGLLYNAIALIIMVVLVVSLPTLPLMHGLRGLTRFLKDKTTQSDQ